MATSSSKAPEARIRTFLAVDTSSEVRLTVCRLQGKLAAHAASIKLVSPEFMHITVRFLGEIGASRMAAVEDAVGAAARQIQPFHCEAAGLGSFSDPTRAPSVIWVGLSRDTGYQRFQDLFQTLDAELRARGFTRERRAFFPHLTLARVPRGASRHDMRAVTDALAQLRESFTSRVVFDIRELIVFRSDTHPSGPVYTPLFRALLGR